MFEDMFFLEILDFYVKFWLLSLLLRWMLSFLPGKLFDIVRYIGSIVRYPVKMFFYWLYGVKVEKVDLEEAVFQTEEVNDFDCRMTSNVVGPLLILTYIGSFLLYWANYFMKNNLSWLGIIFFAFAFSIILMSAPDLKEAESLVHVTIKSIFKWAGKVILISVPAYLLLHYFVGIKTLAQAVFILGLMVPFYFHKHKNAPEKELNVRTKNIIEADPFGK